MKAATGLALGNRLRRREFTRDNRVCDDAHVLRQPATIAAAAAIFVGVTYSVVVPLGLPYDEPAHWSNAQYIGEHARMPALGNPGVLYEAQQGPVAYVPYAIVARAADAAGASNETALRIARMIGIVWLAFSVIALARILCKLLPSGTRVLLPALLVYALNPMLLTMSASVQNDGLALLLGFVVLAICADLPTPTRYQPNPPSVTWAVGVGALIGLAILAKVTVWPLLPAVAVWLVWRYGRPAIVTAGIGMLTAAMVSGWWFARNWHLYRDITARKGVERMGYDSFGPYHVHQITDIGHILQQVVTYLWLPTEYLRNTISAPVPVKAIVVIATIAIVALSVSRVDELRHPRRLIWLTAGLSVAAWIVSYLLVQAVVFRVAYLALPAWIALVELALGRFSTRTAYAISISFVAVLNLWTFYAILALGDLPRFMTIAKP